jgi:hypothetical protein
MMTRAEKIAHNKAEKLIDKVYNENCANIQINVMDIGKIFKVGHAALAAGKDLKTAIVEFVETIRTDKPAQPAT